MRFLFRDLVDANKEWMETTMLFVVCTDEVEATPIHAKAAKSLFGHRPVLWFKDCVVMLA